MSLTFSDIWVRRQSAAGVGSKQIAGQDILREVWLAIEGREVRGVEGTLEISLHVAVTALDALLLTDVVCQLISSLGTSGEQTSFGEVVVACLE